MNCKLFFTPHADKEKLITSNRKILFNIIFTLFVFSFIHATNAQYSIQEHNTPIKIPNINFSSINNANINLDEFKNNIVVMNFFATWCTFCSYQLQELHALKKKYEHQPLKVVTISEDFKDPEMITEFYKKLDIDSLDVFIDHNQKIFNLLKINSIPSTVILNTKGQEIIRISGNISFNNDIIKDILNRHLSNITG